jgi:excisionase family DNA binding protein
VAIEFPQTLSTKETAQILRRHPRTVARWVRAGKIPGTYDGATGLTLVYAEELRGWLRAGEAANRPSPARVVRPPGPRPGDPRELSDEEWRAQFAA